jgi:hypothetical protein
MDAWDSTPRIAFLSPEPASGKSRALEATELLVPNPICTVNVSPAYLFRKIADQDERPTILFDEIDTVFGTRKSAEANEDVRALLNAGHRRGAVVGRCVTRGKAVETEELPAYAAVALAGLGWLPPTLMSRSIIVRMRRRAPGEHVEPFRRRIHEKDGERLRARLARWARAYEKALTDAYPELPEDVVDRDADLWEALIAIADCAGGNWPARARAAALVLVKASKEETEVSLGLRLLRDLKAVFADEAAMMTVDILAALTALPEAPWASLNGQPISDRFLAHRLRQYGVKSRPFRTGLGKVVKGYLRADLHDVWLRYAPATAGSADAADAPEEAEREPDGEAGPPSPPTSVTSVTALEHKSGNGARVTAVTDVTDFQGDGGRGPVCDHCGQPAGQSRADRIELVATPEGPLGGTPVHRKCIDAWFARPPA